MGERKIHPAAAIFLYFVAITTDILQLALAATSVIIPGVGLFIALIVGAFAWIILLVTFHHHNLPFTGRRALRFWIPAFVEIFGVGINAIPVWTLSVYLTIHGNHAAILAARGNNPALKLPVKPL